jgi:lia operon protein LiaF
MRSGRRLFGLLLVAGGVLYLLEQMNAFASLGLAVTPGVLWPLVLVVIGLYGLTYWQRGRIPWFSLFLVIYGGLLGVRNSHLVPPLLHVSTWSLFWCVALILLGMYLLIPRRSRWSRIKVHCRNGVHAVPLEDMAKSWREWNWREWKRYKSDYASWRWVGDISLGRQPWTLKDTELWNAVGDIRVNLTTAHIEDGTHHITIGGWIGDVRVLVPEGLAVTVHASVGLGDLNVFNDHHSGTGRKVHYVDPHFAEAAKRVVINVDLKIGDVQIIRV